MTEEQKILYGLGLAFFLIIYAPPSVIAYRNTKFWLPLRILFSISAVPLFMVLMAVNYWMVSKYVPGLIDFWQSIPEKRQATKPAAIIAVLITCPVSAAGCYVWFQILKLIDEHLIKKAGKFSITAIHRNNQLQAVCLKKLPEQGLM